MAKPDSRSIEYYDRFHPDDGCGESPHCLECPLPQCRFDDPIAHQRWKRRQEDLRIARAVRNNGWTKAEAALVFGKSPRTIYRILARVKMEDL